MTVSTTSYTVTYTASGASAFPVGFMFMSASDLVVVVNNVLKLLNTDYTVVGAGVPGGGTVTFLTAPTAGLQVVISRVTPKLQPADLVGVGPLDVNTLEAMVDRLTLIAQEQVQTTVPGAGASPALHYFSTEAIYGAGVTDITTFPKSCYWKDGEGLVHVELNAQHASATGWTVGTLPVGYRPSGVLQRWVVSTSPGSSSMAQISAAGVITMTPVGATTNCLGTFTFRPDNAVA